MPDKEEPTEARVPRLSLSVEAGQTTLTGEHLDLLAAGVPLHLSYYSKALYSGTSHPADLADPEAGWRERDGSPELARMVREVMARLREELGVG